jgi:hypothetical protein
MRKILILAVTLALSLTLVLPQAEARGGHRGGHGGRSRGCGSRGGPGYRLPNGHCASWRNGPAPRLPQDEKKPELQPQAQQPRKDGQ